MQSQRDAETHLQFRNIITKGQINEKSEDDISNIINSLKDHQPWLHELSVDDIIEYFDKLGKFWKNETILHEKFGISLEHIVDFISKENLMKELSLSLRGNYKVLDTFCTLDNDAKRLYHAQPRGLAVHWIAGNVAVLGIFSIVQALITKNVCLVKAPHEYSILKDIIYSMKDVSTKKIKGKDLLQCIALVYIEKNDFENQQKISLAADTRIAWGGKDAVESILSLKKKFFTEDIIYGPKYSYAVIDEKSVINNKESLAQKLALDISIFDQYACNSPHTILVENSKENNGEIRSFAKLLADAMSTVNRLIIPKQSVSEEKAMDILSLRTEYDIKGEVFCSENTDWTVILSDEEGLAEPCFSRVVFVRPVNNLHTIGKYQNRKIQSISLEIADQNQRIQLADQITKNGGDRCPGMGMMSLYSSPWDGMFAIDRLVRWIPLDVN